ncbi:LysM peptidoglycan-binding domain-containing protein [Rathayibacter rathayi]|uniref:LysM peptidoglycan-binding domain-containing protein n=1 Tax=Rathayibacter rathayi TaxID=33887 RepID=UPI000BD3E928|nr:LysM domain-containing protein [Rathayibacter rathayi]AZZ50044.1 LysM domain-containing protein [Rathayibacter rathayi]MWV75706.1 LysM peptidoglycan-binding domain-containing protein [Rathayibacter rathayi NCPPB 2980 = VKM Ac-1601]PPF23233.1 LysM domain-containing protein [Rathayibacter rathayi]PPF44065.1 LysM domain-containing protein [Rathayibacter rathayi]PPG64649.1 LysM domain-containing protein [Rathayibacter rathayi]
MLPLAGCTAPAPAPTVTVTVFATATPHPSPDPTVTVALPQSTATVYAPVPEVTVSFTPNPTPNIPETAFAVDNGAIAGANGAPTLGGVGDIVSYTVVQGDTFFDIAQRFGIPVQQLLRMNPTVAGAGEAVYINAVINLDASTLG